MELTQEQIRDIENIKQEIICLIEDLYECKFIGKLEVIPLFPMGYTVIIDLFNNTKPIYISGEFTHKKFLKYIKEELRYRQLIDVNLFGLYKYTGKHNYIKPDKPIHFEESKKNIPILIIEDESIVFDDGSIKSIKYK